MVKENGMTRIWSSLITLLAVVVVALAVTGAPAMAQSLDDLRVAGKVGERFDGLAVARDSGAADFVEEVNAKRRKIYSDQAKKQGATIEQVGAVYAQQIMKNAPGGTWFQNDEGDWQQK